MNKYVLILSIIATIEGSYLRFRLPNAPRDTNTWIITYREPQTQAELEKLLMLKNIDSLPKIHELRELLNKLIEYNEITKIINFITKKNIGTEKFITFLVLAECVKSQPIIITKELLLILDYCDEETNEIETITLLEAQRYEFEIDSWSELMRVINWFIPSDDTQENKIIKQALLAYLTKIENHTINQALIDALNEIIIKGGTPSQNSFETPTPIPQPTLQPSSSPKSNTSSASSTPKSQPEVTSSVQPLKSDDGSSSVDETGTPGQPPSSDDQSPDNNSLPGSTETKPTTHTTITVGQTLHILKRLAQAYAMYQTIHPLYQAIITKQLPMMPKNMLSPWNALYGLFTAWAIKDLYRQGAQWYAYFSKKNQ